MSGNEASLAERRSEINITPLVDIVLVLLIIFMIATPFLQKGFEGKLPQGKGNGKAPAAIVLQVAAGGSLRINRQPVGEGDLGEKLNAIFSTRSDRVLFIDADDAVEYGALVRVLDICRMPGRAEGIAFVMD